MSRSARACFVVGLVLVLVGGAIVGTGWAYRQPGAERGDAFAFLGIVLGLVGVLLQLAQLGRGRRLADPRPVDELANLLAQAVDGQWRKAATERRLLTPDPIPTRWSVSELAVTGPVAVAVGALDAPPAFPPLPQQGRITEADLQAGGGRAQLHHVYAGLASGRVVVVGAPGAGKTGTAILLVLDALAHRDRLDDAQRARVPVPVLLTTHGWEPTTTSVHDWLRDQLTTTYPLFTRRGGRTEATALVTAWDKVALILDGLDEMDAALRPVALQALNDAPFRVVVLTRSQEMVQAASCVWLAGAVAVHLHDVTAPDAADYLQRARTGPHPAGWTDLLTHLREHPHGVLARGLSTPLTLTLLRDTYQADDDVRVLLDPTRYRTTDAIKRDLIARVLATAYTPRPGRPPPRYTEQQARQTLSFIARKMDNERDLAWWYISRWAPTTPRVLATGLLCVLVGTLAGVPTLGLAAGLTYGPVMGLYVGLDGGLGRGKPEQVRIPNWGAAISHHLREALARGLVYGLVVGGLVFVLAGGLMGGLADDLVVGLVFTLLSGLAFGLVLTLTERGVALNLPMGPRQAWRNAQLLGLADGLANGLTVGLVGGLMGGFMGGLVGGLVAWLMYGLVGSETWPTTLAWLQLQLARHVPTVSLMPFLEDARERDILRTVGALYQFRHATLQDHLATKPP